MRNKLILGNWKMNFTQREAISVVENFIGLYQPQEKVFAGFAPTFLSIPDVANIINPTRILLGAQDVFWKESGAFTGRISASMLKDVGVQFCIVGHSETRGKFGKLEVPESTIPFFAETNETINLKIKSLLYLDIAPVLCVGETLQERERGETDAIIQTQLLEGLAGIDPSELIHLVIAYEPVWAIGTGKTCDAAEANRVCGMIRSLIKIHLHQKLAEVVPILYGGSVKGSNSKEIFSQTEIDGGLVGGASLDAAEFFTIVQNMTV